MAKQNKNNQESVEKTLWKAADKLRKNPQPTISTLHCHQNRILWKFVRVELALAYIFQYTVNFRENYDQTNITKC